MAHADKATRSMGGPPCHQPAPQDRAPRPPDRARGDQTETSQQQHQASSSKARSAWRRGCMPGPVCPCCERQTKRQKQTKHTRPIAPCGDHAHSNPYTCAKTRGAPGPRLYRSPVVSLPSRPFPSLGERSLRCSPTGACPSAPPSALRLSGRERPPPLPTLDAGEWPDAS